MRVSCLLAALSLCARVSHADTFGSGANSFSIDFVTVGDPGNPPDANPNPAGAVPYGYRIGKYEISEQMIDNANVLGGLAITKDTRGPDYPATSVTWYEAAKFVNWLNTSSGSAPAYKFDGSGNFQLWTPSDAGYDSTNLYRNRLAHYFLPSINEWHKAAYYNPATGTYYTYPTGSNSVPDGIDFVGDLNFDSVFYDGATNGGPNPITSVGLSSPYFTNGQGGNAAEWVETEVNFRNNNPTDSRIFVGGGWSDGSTVLAAWNLNGLGAQARSITIGFRIASTVPEPFTSTLAAIGLLLLVSSGLSRER